MLNRVGHFDIQRELGRGGMGVVYLARDSRLGRDVAIKALPPDLAADPDRLERFQREARTLAALSHPNVAGILGVEEAEGARYLVLEYIDGQSLADRLDAGPLDPDEAIIVGIQIAAGLAAAHEAGIVHRDLKPANIMLAADGTAKILDFGLARTDDAGQSSASGSASRMPNDDLATLTSPVIQHSPTMPGVILGTAAYMSPEQARGRRVDRRSDVWSFGVVLYEMLTGGSPFSGETVSDSIGAILHKDVDLERLPPHAAAGLRRLIARCTQRDPQGRYQDLRDVRLDLMELERDPDAFSGRGGAGVDAAASSVLRRQPPVRVASAAIILTVGVAAGWGLSRTLAPSSMTEASTNTASAAATLAAEPLNVDLWLPALVPPDPPQMIAMSPAERRVAWISTTEPGDANGIQSISVRDLRSGNTTVLAGTEGAASITFSPDGRQIAFGVRTAEGTSIRRIPAAGGPVLTVLSASEDQDVNGTSLAWLPDGHLLLSDGRTQNWFTVDVNSGERRNLGQVTGLEDAAFFGGSLPFDDDLLFLTGFAPARSGTGLNSYVVDLKTMTATLLVADGANAHLAGPNRIAFSRGSTICVAPFDPATRAIAGPVTPVITGLYREMAFSVSERGDLLAVRSEEEAIGSIRVVGEDGVPEIVNGPSTEHTGGIARFPDGTRLLTNITRPEAAIDMPFAAIFDLRTRRTTRLDVASEGRGREAIGISGFEILSDGRVVVGRLYSGIETELVLVDPEGQRPEETVLPGLDEPGGQGGGSATPDGRYILFNYRPADDGEPGGIYMVDLRMAPLERRPIPVLVSDRWTARDAAVSPDGRWLAYITDAAGVSEVFVASFDPLRPEVIGAGIPVASAGSTSPTWSVDGSRVFFLNSDADIVGVSFVPGETPTVGPPVVLVPSEVSQIQASSWIGRSFVELPGAGNDDESPRFAYHWDEAYADTGSLRGDLRVNWVRSLDERLGE